MKALLGSSTRNSVQLVELETKLCWLTYIMASFIGERTSYGSADADDLADGDMSVRLFQLMSLQHAVIAQVCLFGLNSDLRAEERRHE